jgi:hypothetical protein
MVDYLCREFNLTNAHSLQACLERVCGGLVRFFTGDRIRKLVWNMDGLMEKGQTRPTLATSVFYEGFYAHKLLASLVFQAYDLVEKLLPGAVDDRIVRWFRHDEMTPLQFAVITNDEKLLDIILRYCSSIDGDLAWDIFAINWRLTDVLERKNLPFVQKLSQYLANVYTGRYHDFEQYDGWMDLTIDSGDHRIAEALFPLHFQGHMFSTRHFTMACRNGNLDLVSLFIQTGELNPNQVMDWKRSSAKTLPLLYAVSLGNLNLILTIIDAGATVDENAQVTALKYNHWHVFEYLRSLGDPLPTMDLWPRKMSRTIYHNLRELKVEDGADRQTLPLYDTWKHMSRPALRIL